MTICKYCKNSVSKSGLKRHQTTTKYCLKIQGIVTNNIYKCSFKSCGAEFSRPDHLEAHKKNCKLSKNDTYAQTKKNLKKYKRNCNN